MTRCFVVGNGPSLTSTNLDLMQGEVSFACNNIHLLYNRTAWRPTHYVRAEQYFLQEPKFWQESMDAARTIGAEIWCNAHFAHDERVNIIRGCAHCQKHYDSPECPHLLHLPMLCTFGSSVNVAVQIAMLKKYSPIYLIGCDLGYKDGQPSHFDKDYENGYEQQARYANLDTLAAHMVAARSDYEIYNATVGGLLEVYPRVDYESLFVGKGN